jgi:Mg2+ and Co2+ transporter CorA
LIVQEELNSRLSEQMNRAMYTLSIVAAIFLPLGLLTGLLGINVGGIPGTESPWAFLVVTLFYFLRLPSYPDRMVSEKLNGCKQPILSSKE